jgi:hypothetical protein
MQDILHKKQCYFFAIECARTRFWLTNQKLAKPICCSNGNYRPIQCRGGVCFCVDDDGNQTGLEVQENNLTELQCYQLKQYPDCWLIF